MDNVSAGSGGSSEAKCSMSDTESDEQQSGRLIGDDNVKFLKVSDIGGNPFSLNGTIVDDQNWKEACLRWLRWGVLDFEFAGDHG